MATPVWMLTLLVSDGRHPCSRSRASGPDLQQVIPALTETLHPPRPPASRAVWVRVDALPPDPSPQWGGELMERVQKLLLPSLGIVRQPQALQSSDGRLLHLWLDLSRPSGAATMPLLEAQERALAWWQRQMERPDIAEEPAIHLAALQLLHVSAHRPELELAAFRLTRAVLQASDTAESRNVHQLRHRRLLELAVLAQQHSQQPRGEAQLMERCRQLRSDLLASLDGLPPARTAAGLFSLALAQARGIGEAELDAPLQALATHLQQVRGAAAARNCCLLSLVVLAEAGCLGWTPQPDQVQAIAALNAPEQIRGPSSALRALLMLRLIRRLQGVMPSTWHEFATAVLLRHQCGAAQAIEADDPQQVLGGFGGSRRGPAPMAQQLIPLLALDQLRQLNDSHAPV